MTLTFCCYNVVIIVALPDALTFTRYTICPLPPRALLIYHVGVRYLTCRDIPIPAEHYSDYPSVGVATFTNVAQLIYIVPCDYHCGDSRLCCRRYLTFGRCWYRPV